MSSTPPSTGSAPPDRYAGQPQRAADGLRHRPAAVHDLAAVQKVDAHAPELVRQRLGDQPLPALIRVKLRRPGPAPWLAAPRRLSGWCGPRTRHVGVHPPWHRARRRPDRRCGLQRSCREAVDDHRAASSPSGTPMAAGARAPPPPAFSPHHPVVTHRPVPTRRRPDLRTVQRDPTQRHQPGLGTRRQRLGEQLLERLRVPGPEPADRHEVRRLGRGASSPRCMTRRRWCWTWRPRSPWAATAWTTSRCFGPSPASTGRSRPIRRCPGRSPRSPPTPHGLTDGSGHEVARWRETRVGPTGEPHRALDDVERLVVRAVDVRRRPGPARFEAALDQAHPAVHRGAVRQHAEAHRPGAERLSGARSCQPEGWTGGYAA